MPDMTRCFACGSVTVQRGLIPPQRCPRCQSKHWFDPSYPHHGKHTQLRLLAEGQKITQSTAQNPMEHANETAVQAQPAKTTEPMPDLPADQDPGPLPEGDL